jgi:hypothetical protein
MTVLYWYACGTRAEGEEMRTWISFPIAKGIRVGASVNPGGFVTRQLHWTECLSDHGRQVQSAGAGVIAFCMWFWVFADLSSLNTMWLTMLLVWLVLAWIWKRIMLAHFPRNFEETDEPAAPPKCQPWGTYRS